MLLQSSSHALTTHNYGLFILQTLLALVAMGILGWAVVKLNLTHLGKKTKNRRLKIVEWLPLDMKRTLFLVEVDGQSLLIGTGEKAIHVLKEMPPDSNLPATDDTMKPSETPS